MYSFHASNEHCYKLVKIIYIMYLYQARGLQLSTFHAKLFLFH